jgi:zinc transporter ZupT
MPALNEAVLNAFGHALFAGLATPIGSVIAFFAKQTDYRFLSIAMGFRLQAMRFTGRATEPVRDRDRCCRARRSGHLPLG